jgi:hypothetical protein
MKRRDFLSKGGPNFVLKTFYLLSFLHSRQERERDHTEEVNKFSSSSEGDSEKIHYFVMLKAINFKELFIKKEKLE